MVSRLTLALLCLLAVSPASPARAQDPTEDTETAPQLDMEYDDFMVKAYTISIFGGWFSGAEYLNLPVRGDRTYVSAGSDDILGFDGENLVYDRDIYDGPVKKLDTGTGFGMKLGTWLNDDVHIDLAASYASSQAILTMVNKNPDDPDHPFTEEIDRDPNVTIYRASLTLNYELGQFRVLGIHPSIGLGFGGIINRFTNIKDRGELYLAASLGLERPLAGNVGIFGRLNTTTFAMNRSELQYNTRLTYVDAQIGLTYFVDVLPPAVRHAHAEDVKSRSHHVRH